MTILSFLDKHGLAYERFDHFAVFTCKQVNENIPDLPGAKTKNLFLCDDKARRHFLVVVSHAKQVELKKLAEIIGLEKIRFASSGRLSRYLGAEPGSVTLLGLANDNRGDVTAIIDKEIWNASAIQRQRLVNTSTLVIQQNGTRRFLEKSGHTPKILCAPSRT